MLVRRDVFQAIADPTRREIIGLIAKEPLKVNTIADSFQVTRQAVSLHIKILEECGLIVVKQIGRERFCEARLEKLGEVNTWVEQYRKFWMSSFKSLRNFLDQETSKTGKSKKKTKSKKSS